LANKLNLVLSNFDLSTIVTKYIGESERKIEPIFKRMEMSWRYYYLMKQMLYLDKEQKYVISMINTQTYCLNI